MAEQEKKIVGITCVACKKTFKMYHPNRECTQKITCPHCKHQMNIKFQALEPAAPSAGQQNPLPIQQKTRDISSMMGRGKLIQLRGFLKKNISHTLQLGDNTIGRYDEAQPSQIMIKGDGTISRRSVSIHVEMKGNGFTYELKVLKAKNQVLLNGTIMMEGEGRYLNFNDIIQLGTTKFRFEEV